MSVTNDHNLKNILLSLNLNQLKIVQINSENLFLLGTTAINSSTDNPLSPKSVDKTQDLANALLDIDADIICLCEVGGKESLDLFNGVYLKNQCLSTLITGNSDRGIELGYLIKKNLGIKLQHFTHKKRTIGVNPLGETATFSRDLGELRFFCKSSPEKPFLTILHSHLKSKWDRTGLDPLGKKQRGLEVQAMIDVYKNLLQNFPDCPVIIAGDLNGLADKENGEDEFRPFFNQTDLRDILDVIELPLEKRVTFVHFERDSAPIPQQLDYIFVPHSLHSLIDHENSGIYHYKDSQGKPLS